MLKILRLTVVFSLLIPLLPEIVWTRPIFLSQYPELQNSDLDSASCYFQTADGRILNLDRLCGRSSNNTSNNNSETAEPTVNNTEVRTEPVIAPPPPVNNSPNNSGNQPCFGLDQNGRPCGR
jgi:hypothetical protein